VTVFAGVGLARGTMTTMPTRADLLRTRRDPPTPSFNYGLFYAAETARPAALHRPTLEGLADGEISWWGVVASWWTRGPSIPSTTLVRMIAAEWPVRAGHSSSAARSPGRTGSLPSSSTPERLLPVPILSIDRLYPGSPTGERVPTM